jgi:hypothetical protein
MTDSLRSTSLSLSPPSPLVKKMVEYFKKNIGEKFFELSSEDRKNFLDSQMNSWEEKKKEEKKGKVRALRSEGDIPFPPGEKGPFTVSVNLREELNEEKKELLLQLLKGGLPEEVKENTTFILLNPIDQKDDHQSPKYIQLYDGSFFNIEDAKEKMEKKKQKNKLRRQRKKISKKASFRAQSA